MSENNEMPVSTYAQPGNVLRVNYLQVEEGGEKHLEDGVFKEPGANFVNINTSEN